jgi:hypothetical protein
MDVPSGHRYKTTMPEAMATPTRVQGRGPKSTCAKTAKRARRAPEHYMEDAHVWSTRSNETSMDIPCVE